MAESIFDLIYGTDRFNSSGVLNELDRINRIPEKQPTNPQPQQRPQPKTWYNNLSRVANQKDSDVDGFQNIPKVIAQTTKGLVDLAGFVLENPVESAQVVNKIAGGLLQQPLPDRASWDKESKQMIRDVVSEEIDRVAEKYTDFDKFREATRKNVFETGAELSGLSLLTKLGAKASKSLFDKGIQPGMSIKEVPDNEKLIVQHNLTPDALKKQEEGLPIPSIAISKAERPVTGFGEITLLGDTDMIKPSGKTKTYPSDIYSGRAPEDWLEYKNPEMIAKELGSDTLDWYGAYTMYDVKPGDLEEKMLTTAKMEAMGYNPKNYKNYNEMRGSVMREMIDAGKEPVRTVIPTPDQYLGETKRVMTHPLGLFTNIGNRRDPVDYSVEKAYQVMKKNKAYLPGKEGFESGGQARAMTSLPFKSLSEIKKNRGKIQSKEKTTFDKERFNSDYEYLLNQIEEISGRKFDSWLNASQFTNGIVEDVLGGRDIKWAKLTTEKEKKIRKLLNKLKTKGRSLSTDYFESKPNRIVDLGEFKGAIVPEGDKESIKILKDKGIKKIYKYKNDEERIELFKKFPELMFSKALIPTTGLLATQEEDNGKLNSKQGLLD